MSNLSQAEILEALGTLLAGNEPAPEVEKISPEMQLAIDKRDNSIRSMASNIASDMKAVLEKYDFDSGIMLQTAASGLAPFISVRDQYFWSRSAADRAGQRLARLESTGQWDDVARGRSNSDDDGAGGQGEINPIRQAEEALAFHTRNAEQYEILNHAYAIMWMLCESDQLTDSGKEATFIPDSDLGEAEYQKYLQRQEKRFQSKRNSEQVSTNAQASQLLRRTTTSFIHETAPAPAEPAAAE